jgi:hypothetical protein
METKRSEIDNMMQFLEERFDQDPETHITPRLMRWLSDPLKPQDENGRFRVNPLVLIMLVVCLIAAGAFLYYGYWMQ